MREGRIGVPPRGDGCRCSGELRGIAGRSTAANKGIQLTIDCKASGNHGKWQDGSAP